VSLPPPGKTVWPPEKWQPAYDQYATNATWWAGDPEQLSSLYDGGQGWVRGDTRYRVSQFRGGVVGRMARWFWGQPAPDGELRAKLHLPLASDITGMSANMLFAEPPKLTVGNAQTQDRLDVLTDLTGLHSTLLEGADVAGALGDVYPCVTWDTSIRDEPWIRVVHGDAVVPEFRAGMLAAATIWTVVKDDHGKIWRHLERHEKGVVLHGLYVGGVSTLGDLVDLREHEDTEQFPEQVVTGVDRLLIQHVPNLRPNRLDRGSPLGRSLFSPAVLGLMDQLDEVWSSLAREYRLAKARAVITEDAVKSQGPGQGAVFDDRELLMPLRINPNQQGTKPVELIQPLIRVEEHLAGCRALTEEIIRSCGFSINSFGRGQTDQAAATATEIQQRSAQSYLTRGMQTLHWGSALRASVHTLLEVDAAAFGSKVTPERPEIVFGDTVAESDAQTAQTLATLAQAEAASIKTRVKRLNPEWADEAVAEEVEAIMREQGRSVPDPVALVHDDTSPMDAPTDVPADGPEANALPAARRR